MFGNEAILASAEKKALHDSNWLSILISDITDEDLAKRLAKGLKLALDLSALAHRIGIDTGANISTSSFSKFVKDAVNEEFGISMRDNIHGVDIFPMSPPPMFVSINATATVSFNPSSFLELLAQLSTLAPLEQKLEKEAEDIIVLFSHSLMIGDPVGRLVASLSAVESFANTGQWSPAQKSAISSLIDQVDTFGLSLGEKAELRETLEKARRFSLRQGVVRFLQELGLGHLRGAWDHYYSERSKLVHGLAPRRGQIYTELSSDIQTMCGHILLKKLETFIPPISGFADKYYSIDPLIEKVKRA